MPSLPNRMPLTALRITAVDAGDDQHQITHPLTHLAKTLEALLDIYYPHGGDSWNVCIIQQVLITTRTILTQDINCYQTHFRSLSIKTQLFSWAFHALFFLLVDWDFFWIV